MVCVCLPSFTDARLDCKEFLRKREANLEQLAGLGGTGKSVAGEKSIFGCPIPELGEGPIDQPSWDKMEKKAENIEQRKGKRKDRLEQGEQGEPQPSKKIPKVTHSIRWNHRDAGKDQHAGLPPGCALVLSSDCQRVIEILQWKGFRVFAAEPLVHQTLDFVKAAWALSARRKVGHLVVVNNLAACQSPLVSLAAQFCGGLLVEGSEISRAVARGSSPTGIQLTSSLQSRSRVVFVHADVASKETGLVEVLTVGATLPGSKLCLADSLSKVQKKFLDYKENHGLRSKPELFFKAVVPEEIVKQSARLKYPRLFCSCKELSDFLGGPVRRDLSCPGW